MPRPDIVQVQFSSEEAERVRKAAEVIGLSQSAFVRQLVLSKILVPAWWVRPFYNPGLTVEALRSTGQEKMMEFAPEFFLELLYETQDGGAAYRVFGNSRAPLRSQGLRPAGVEFRDLGNGRIMMAGDRHAMWRVVRSIEDANMGGQLLWLLAPDRRSDREPADVQN